MSACVIFHSPGTPRRPVRISPSIASLDETSGEGRFVIIGISANMRLPAVCHCVREAGRVIRIISARRAVKAEPNQYRERLIR